MRRAAVLLAFFALGLAPGSVLAQARRHRLVVAELFTAQGCVSCDKAEAGFAALAQKPGVIAVTLPVDYWDYLGWRDTFAQPEFTDRQKAYERRLGLRDVYTPQLIVNGADQAPGDDPDAVDAVVAKARHARAHGPEIRIRRDGRVEIGAEAGRRRGAEVWLMRFDPHLHAVEVKAGDNRGATVADRNVVRQIVRLGTWSGDARGFKLPAADQEGLASLILVQGAHGGRILAARVLTADKP